MKIPFNWGTGITIFIILFFLAIAFLLIKANSIDVDLVEKDYYPRGLEYQDVIDGKQRLVELGQEPSLEIFGEMFRITLPSYFDTREIAGSVLIYRPSDARMDIHDSIYSPTWSIDHTNLYPGRYTIILNWESEGLPYYWESTYNYEKP